MGKKAPRAPDPYATAQAQSSANIDAARQQATMNRGDTFTPYGTVTNQNLGADWARQHTDRMLAEYSAGRYKPAANGGNFDWGAEYSAALNSGINPDRDRWSSIVTLSPEQQRIYDQGTELDIRTGQVALNQIPRLDRIISSDIDTSRMPSWMTADAGAQQRAEQAILARLEPQFDRDRNALEGRLSAQGFTPGSEGYATAADELGRARNDARMQAVLAGLNESRASAGFNNTVRQGQLGETLQLRAQPINEVAALFGLGPGMQAPQPLQQAQVGVNAPDLAGMIYQNYNAQNQQVQANNANWFGLGGALLGAGGSALGGYLRR